MKHHDKSVDNNNQSKKKRLVASWKGGQRELGTATGGPSRGRDINPDLRFVYKWVSWRYMAAPGTPDATWKTLLKVSLYIKCTARARLPGPHSSSTDGEVQAAARHYWV